MEAGGFSGSGPGAIARDGCSVELYRRLPYLGELEGLRPHLPVGSSVLELGCGVGRLTRALLGFGLRVTGVDNSPEMLAHMPPFTPALRADIESLALPRCFDTVLLASYLIHHPSTSFRRRLLRSCRLHLEAGGQLIFEYLDPIWLSQVRAGTVASTRGVEVRIANVDRSATTVHMTVAYRCDGHEWTHTMTHAILDRSSIDRALSLYGFGPTQWLDNTRGSQGSQGWARAVLAENPRD